MQTRVIVSAIIEDEDKLLLGKKRENVGPYPNTWHLIGGGINENESLEESVKREIREEAGIEVEVIETLPFDEDYEPNKHGELTYYIFLVYKVKYKSGTPKADDDIKMLQWFPKDNLPINEMNRASVKLFKKIGYIA
jgi:ADP-ribose pyrophosphatase YjhB (NUDIX family)